MLDDAYDDRVARLDDIARRAVTLQERLDSARESPLEMPSNESAKTLFEQWKDALSADGRDACLSRRLSWSGADAHARGPMLARFDMHAAPLFSPSRDSPSWVGTLKAVVRATAEHFDANREQGAAPGVNQADPRPFEELFVPAVELATRKVLSRLGRLELSARMRPSAFEDVQRQLLVDLTELGAKALYREFVSTRTYGTQLLLSLGITRGQRAGRSDYDAFVRRHGADGLLMLFGKYPVLGRLVATFVDAWADATAEFIVRLERDFDRLTSVAAPGGPLPEVVGIRTGLSDRHQHGRSVLILTFRDNRRVVYKPRDLRLHAAFEAFLTWCSVYANLGLECPRVLLGDGYGWLEYIDAAPVGAIEDARRFYRRAGELLAVVSLLGGTDCHFENLRAKGQALYLLDTESLLQPGLTGGPEDGADPTRRVWDSVLQTGLLPSWEFSVDRRVAVDLSGLGDDPFFKTTRHDWGWSAINTDDMHRRLVPVEPYPHDNVPAVDDPHFGPAQFTEELTDGFTRAYRALMSMKTELLDADGPLERFRGLPTRFIFRPTKVYAAVLARCLDPDHLESGVTWGLQLEVLGRLFVQSDSRPAWWGLLDAELADMSRFDVPYFAGCTTDTLLRSSRGDLDVLECAWSDVRARIASLSEDELAFDLDLIRSTHAARASAIGWSESGRSSIDAAPTSELTREICLTEAERLATMLVARALRDRHGTFHWVGFEYVPEARRLQFDLVSQGLYDGRCGIALFLAALDRVTGRDEYLPIWTRTLQPFRAVLDADSDARSQFVRSGVGLASGFGGVMLSCVRLAAIAPATEQAWLLDLASHAAGCMTRSLAERDDELDLLGGNAGAIVGLLALYSATQDPSVLDRAVWCGRRLALEYRDRLSRSRRTSRPHLTGVSHGASGVALALLSLYARTGDRTFARTSRLALGYEAGVYDATRGNWPDYRFDESQPSWSTSWCHGAPGIGLARLGMLALDNDLALETQWTAAIETTSKVDVLDVDNLCCGNLGLCDVLWTSAQLRQREDLRASAMTLAARVVDRARRESGFRMFAGTNSTVFNPGFFQGASGIGYQLLRLAHPDLLPSILLCTPEAVTSGGK
jgi:type 2 lantibiotic biosynthesis protein LanM